MKKLLPTPTRSMRWLTGLGLLVTCKVAAQCPTGSISNSSGTFHNKQTVCISTNFSGAITLNNGATLVIVNGGNYTGNLESKQGSDIEVQSGGRLAPSSMNNFAGTLTVNTGAEVFLNNTGFSNGASINNSGNFVFNNAWSAGIQVTNMACGVMTFRADATANNNGDLINNGIMNFLGKLNLNNGSSINNRGSLYVAGALSSSGLIYNQYKAVFKSSANLNAGDSVVNLGFMVFYGSVISSPGIRNDGFFQIAGSWTHNSGGKFLINNANAYVRVGGAVVNNEQITGTGSLHVTGAFANNNTVSGKSLTQRLRLNKATGGTSTNTLINSIMPMYDTTNYAAAMANPDLCNNLLPLRLSGLQAAYNDGKVYLRWNGDGATTQTYTIEYSTDGRNYMPAGEVSAAQIATEAAYRFTHITTATGTLYYRIRETGLNGQVQYSQVMILKTAISTITTNVFPNPFTDNLQVNITLFGSSPVEIALYDSHGQLIKKAHQEGQAGVNAISLNGLRSLLPGVYVARITAGTKTVYSKLIK